MSLSQQLAALVPQPIREYIDAKVSESEQRIASEQRLIRLNAENSAKIFHNEFDVMNAQLRVIRSILKV